MFFLLFVYCLVVYNSALIPFFTQFWDIFAFHTLAFLHTGQLFLLLWFYKTLVSGKKKWEGQLSACFYDFYPLGTRPRLNHQFLPHLSNSFTVSDGIVCLFCFHTRLAFILDAYTSQEWQKGNSPFGPRRGAQNGGGSRRSSHDRPQAGHVCLGPPLAASADKKKQQSHLRIDRQSFDTLFLCVCFEDV